MTEDKAGSRHSIADHAYGERYGHDHGGGDFDHDHDHDFIDDGPAKTQFLSLGLDIGSSSTQLAFSCLTAEGGAWAHQTLFLSPIAPTPFLPDGRIDAVQLRRIVDAGFAAAGLTPDAVETGVMILTGAAAARGNALAISAEAEDLGELVCAAAGHHMEARLSAQGSGAVADSRDGRRILAVDVGGATTKLALVEAGRILGTAALAAGGRLVVIDRNDRLSRLDPEGAQLARRAGLDWHLGDRIDPADRLRLAKVMAEDILHAATGRGVELPWLTAPLPPTGPLDGILLAGGVGEYVYGREARDFGDLGRVLGRALAAHLRSGAFGAPLLPPRECIRATVLGAAEHSLSLSGETIFISNHRELLPRKALPVIAPPCDLSAEALQPEPIAEAIRSHLAGFDLQHDPTRPVALALRWQGLPEYARIAALARGIAGGMDRRIAARTPLYILIDGDLAQSLGRVLKEELRVNSELLVLDRISAADFTYVDLGRVRLPSHTVPVTVRSLIFGGART